MRLLVLLIATGCGRIGFDTSPSPAPVPDDGPADGAAAPVKHFVTSGDNAVVTHLYELDIATGELTDLGSLGTTYPLGGLAMWDPNTLYATGSTKLHQITLSPFQLTIVADVGGSIPALARDGDDLIGTDQNDNTLVRIPIATMTPARTAIKDNNANPVSISGGDLVQLSDGTWRMWTNAPQQLFDIDPVTAIASPLGSPDPNAPFISGLTRDDADNVLMTASGDDTIVKLDPKTGAVVGTVSLCSPCPSAFDLLNGDTARSP